MYYMNAEISYIIECDRCDERFEEIETRTRINEEHVGPIDTENKMQSFLDKREEEGWQISDPLDFDVDSDGFETLCPSCAIAAQGE